MESGDRHVPHTFRGDLKEAVHELWKRTSADHKRVVLLLVLAGAALRSALLFEPVTYDEAHAYIRFSSRSFSDILSDYSLPGNHILHTLLVKLSTGVLGVGTWQMRLPALLAGIATLPLLYLFTRAMFNRYIAMLALALAAGSGPLIELSALARGYSLSWMFFLMALLMGRYVAKRNSVIAAVLLGLINALGFWSVPTMLYATAMVYAWLPMYILDRYDSTVRRRLGRVLLSVVLFLVFSALLYTPVMLGHDVAQLFYHPMMGDNSWEAFSASHYGATVDLWIWISETGSNGASIMGMLGLLYAIYVSSKFRFLLVALVAGAVPLVIVQRLVGPPQTWAYSILIFHIGSGIAIFYLLKLIEERLAPSFSKRLRTQVASVALLVGFGTAALFALFRPGRIERFGDAARAAGFIAPALAPADRVMAEFPWDAPLEFYLRAYHADPQVMRRDPSPAGTLYIVASPADGQDPASVLQHNKLPGHHAANARKVKDWKRLEVYTTRLID
jgi:hypothetical protein